MSSFVSVGNATQPFPRLLDAVAQLAYLLPQPVIVQYGNNIFSVTRCEAVAFMDMHRFEKQVREAKLLIFHAGAGSVINAVRAGKVPVVMPRRAQFGEHVDDHQMEFAYVLAETSKIVIAQRAEDLPEAVARALALQQSRRIVSTSSRMLEVVQVTLDSYSTKLCS